MIKYSCLSSKLGVITFIERGGELVALNVGDAPNYPASAAPANTRVLSAAKKQMREYLGGKRKEFDLPIAPIGTKFQQSVWRALLKIPFGKTVSYADIANSVEKPKGQRAVGGAVGKNPIPIIIPCHRVIATSGKLGGFSLGLPMKRKLLCLEMPLKFLP
ncbi:MAG: methylated-DNA--[protein]-cysteine S-methyltransferase [Alphaproteobacteria bacterium]|nr:methylated-DNA--[protein]-cysteine S-methyltransferase [Alphaproteobacteria bacterium]MCL2758434.1 methylated-DNA--[protein]-cysteine S-methyltransferase [Alphaproteobacteria bacterium]